MPINIQFTRNEPTEPGWYFVEWISNQTAFFPKLISLGIEDGNWAYREVDSGDLRFKEWPGVGEHLEIAGPLVWLQSEK